MIRSVVETGAPIFSGGLSQTNISDIEEVQKAAFQIILRGDYKNYESALSFLGEKTLEKRRENISLKFAKSCVNHPKMSHRFEKRENVRTRSGATFVESLHINSRGYNGPIS